MIKIAPATDHSGPLSDLGLECEEQKKNGIKIFERNQLLMTDADFDQLVYKSMTLLSFCGDFSFLTLCHKQRKK